MNLTLPTAPHLLSPEEIERYSWLSGNPSYSEMEQSIFRVVEPPEGEVTAPTKSAAEDAKAKTALLKKKEESRRLVTDIFKDITAFCNTVDSKRKETSVLVEELFKCAVLPVPEGLPHTQELAARESLGTLQTKISTNLTELDRLWKT